MTLHCILLVLLSACCHTTWNLLSKSAEDPVAFMKRALRFSTFIYFPLFLYLQWYVVYDRTYLTCLLLSGTCTGIYFYCLARAYRAGHVSIAYPIARSFPILVVTWAGLFLNELPSTQALAGIILIVGGAFLLPLKRFCLGSEGFSLKNYFTASAAWAFMAALLTSIYSLLDKYAASHAAPDISLLAQQVNYVYLQNFVGWILIHSLLHLRKTPLSLHGTKRAAASGVIFLISYSLIMVAFTTAPAAYVVSFRQISIVMTAILSMLLFEKDFSRPRLLGVLVIFIGIVLVGLG